MTKVNDVSLPFDVESKSSQTVLGENALKKLHVLSTHFGLGDELSVQYAFSCLVLTRSL